MPDGIIVTGSSSASPTNVSSFVVVYRLVPFEEHVAAVQAQILHLAFAVSPIETNIEQRHFQVQHGGRQACLPFLLPDGTTVNVAIFRSTVSAMSRSW